MSNIKSTITRAVPGSRVSTEGASSGHLIKRSSVNLPQNSQQDAKAIVDRRASEPTLISEFIAPPSETSEWLRSPSIGSILAAVSSDLAPNGVANSQQDQYVASVVETHLVARRQLAKHLNSLLRA